jgi:ubiquitin carboxyl-terminal hydrolase 4/11/15
MAEVSMCSSSVTTAAATSTELLPQEERVLIRDIALVSESNCKEGDFFYLINQRWWQHWIDYVNQDQPNNTNDVSSLSEHCDSAGSSTLKRPSGIDNSDLIYDTTSEFSNTGTEIHDTLLEGRDYVLLPEEVWNRLQLWYGGGPKLERKVISSGLSQTELAVEVYPLRLQLLLMPKDDRSIVRISKKETIGELYRRACEIFCLNLEQVRIWDYYGHRKHALMNDMDKTLDDINIQMDQEILVEVINQVNVIPLGGPVGSVLSNGHAEKPATCVPVEPSKSSLSIAGGLSASNGFKSRNADLTQSQNSVSIVKEPDQTWDHWRNYERLFCWSYWIGESWEYLLYE